MPKGGTAEFTAQVRKFNRKAQEKLEKQLKRVCLKAFESVVQKTPVLTGCARGNWRVSFGPELPRGFDLTVRDAGGGRTVSLASSMITASARVGTRVNITNSVPYIIRLERGYSRQAPQGMVHVTVDELVRSELVYRK